MVDKNNWKILSNRNQIMDFASQACKQDQNTKKFKKLFTEQGLFQ